MIILLYLKSIIIHFFLKNHNFRCDFRYVFSLALADLLVIIICVPFTSIYYTVDYWPWSEAVCKLYEYTKEISLGVSIFTLTALSAERYSIIVDPLRRLQVKILYTTYKKKNTPTNFREMKN